MPGLVRATASPHRAREAAPAAAAGARTLAALPYYAYHPFGVERAAPS